MGCRKARPPKLEPLEPRLLLSAISDLLDSATALAVTTPVDMSFTASIDQPRQSDLYQFTAEASSNLVIEMFAEGGPLDPYLRLYQVRRGKLRSVARNNNAYRGTLDSTLTYSLQPGGVYYISAQGRRKTTGEYGIRIRTTLDDPHGDTLADATAILLSGSGRAKLYGGIDYEGDVDVIRFCATRTGQMKIVQSARRRREPVACVLSAYDGDGNLLATNASTAGSGKYSTVHLDVVAGREYYVSPSGHQGATGSYRLRISTKRGHVPPSPPPPPPPDPAPDPDPPPDPDGDPPVEVVPGSQVTVHQRSAGSGLELLVLGTDGADSILLTQTAGGITVASGAGTRSYGGVFSSVVIYGFAGDDVIRLANSVTTADVIYAGDGNDQIFDAGTGAGGLHGGGGDDLIVSIGGSADSLRGEAGFDSFWMDSADTIGDVSTAEHIGTAVHEVTAFYQPYAAGQGAPGYVPLEIAGQDLADPDITGYASGYANFSHRPLFASGPNYNDIDQGSLGDCYLLASLASLAETDPQLVEQMIAPLGDGTFAVRLYNGNTPVYVRLDGDLPVRSNGSLAYAELGPGGELWVALAEKAYAYFRYGQNSYASLHGGWMGDVYRHFTARATASRSTGNLGEGLYSYLETQLSAGHPVTLGSYYTASGPIVAGHAYMVKGVSTDTPGNQYVTVYNPWGNDGRYWDANYADGLLTLSTSQVLLYFSAVVTCIV